MSFYEYQKEDAYRFAEFKGIEAYKKSNNLIFKKCPYCGMETNKKDKFAIDLNTGMFNCFRASCGAKGNMITLSKDFNFSLGKNADAYYRTVDYSKKSYKTFKDSKKSIEVRQGALQYLANRGISEEIIKKYEITTLPDNNDVIVFPFKNQEGELTFVKYRNAAYVKGESGNKEWCEKDCKPILFGMNHCDPEKNKTLIITEGQIDSLSVAEANIDNAVSVPTGCNGFTWVPYCWDFVNQFEHIVIFGDCENGKITLVEELSKRWANKIKIVRVEDYKDCKDANEILQKYGKLAIKAAVENATIPDNPFIKQLAKVKQVDIMKMETLSTGMCELDQILDGGFRMGQLAVLTGRRGEGKSTIASMWGVRALAKVENPINCYFYSGELPDFYFKNWMDCQVTGKETHTKSEEDALALWYGDRAFIYDDTVAGDDEFISVLEAIKIAIERYDCRFIMLDNLMTAIDDDLSSDLYRNQSIFVGNLAKMAKKYNVFILLIAHPRKTYGKIENDSIAGSSNITDKADIVMAYGRPEYEEGVSFDDTERVISVIKNRLTGKLNFKPIKLTYERSSRRVLDKSTNPMHVDFGWNTSIDIDDDENPFVTED